MLMPKHTGLERSVHIYSTVPFYKMHPTGRFCELETVFVTDITYVANFFSRAMTEDAGGEPTTRDAHAQFEEASVAACALTSLQSAFWQKSRNASRSGGKVSMRFTSVPNGTDLDGRVELDRLSPARTATLTINPCGT